MHKILKVVAFMPVLLLTASTDDSDTESGEAAEQGGDFIFGGPDTSIREGIYKEAPELLIDEAPAIYMRQAESMNAYRDELKRLVIDRYNSPDFQGCDT